jgi:predicted enzyme related to lactoylglutathione lyase
VPDIGATVDDLSKRGVQFERYGGMDQDTRGIWNAPGGAKVAWFKDPDGNILSLTEL